MNNFDDQRLQELGQFTPEGKLTPGYGDHYLFMVGRDDVHGILKYLIGLETLAFKFNMFGYDDEELNAVIMGLIQNKHVSVQASLDRSQASGIHEKTILTADETADPDFANSFCILESATHQISHTKGGVLVGQGIAFEGSTNWSASGEGEGIVFSGDQPKGFKAQNNTLLVSTNQIFINRFSARLDAEHVAGLQQRAQRLAQGKNIN